MDDRTVPAQLAEPGLEADRDVQQIAVAHRMFDGARIAQRPDVRGQLDDRLTQREVDAQALDGRLARRHHLEFAPAHPLADGHRVLLGDGAPAIHVARLDLADAHDVGTERGGRRLQVPGSLPWRREAVTCGRDLAGEARFLFLPDPAHVLGGFRDVDRTTADLLVPVLPREGGRRRRGRGQGHRGTKAA